MQQHVHIQYGKRTIAFSVEYSSRKTLALYVHPSQAVEVRAPNGTPLRDIEQRVRKRAAWIVQQQRYFAACAPVLPPRRYVNGETHWYLGRQYRLRVESAERGSVVLRSGWLHVLHPNAANKNAIAQQLGQWYRQRAQLKFAELLQQCLPRFAPYGITCERVHVRAMPKRWGSYTALGNVVLNPKLVQTPLGCIDYVLTHELCHAVEPAHNKAFYALQTRLLPDWQRWKNKLETFAFL